MLPPAARDAAAKSRAAAAAAVAAAGAAPGQRDRAIQQAVLAAQQARDAAAAAAAAPPPAPAAGAGAGDGGGEQQPGGEPPAAAGAADGAAAAASAPAPAAPAGTYEPPEWSGVADGAPFGVEVLKSGVLVEARLLEGQPFYTFGRNPAADFLLEHPSASRLHAVLQFKSGTQEAYLYDCGSTHGTFLNKNRLRHGVHAPIRVGDQVRFGQSSRTYVLTGPQELLPAEGLSKVQLKQLAMLEAAQRRKDADEAKARAQMEAAIARSAGDGATWGMDLGDDGDGAGGGSGAAAVNWRSYVERNSLTDRQTKLLDKIRKREYKVKNLEAECAKIAAKERNEGGLTQGQASTMVRNERALEALREELEELEEQLTECIQDSIDGKKAARDAKEGKDAAEAKKRKRGADSDEEYAGGSDSGDEFYDRTAAAGPKRGAGAKAKAGAAAAKGGDAGGGGAVESAQSLYAKREALQEEAARLEAAVAAEQAQLAAQAAAPGGGGGAPAAPGAGGGAGGAGAADGGSEAGVDSLDAFMSDVQTNLERDKVSSAAPSSPAAPVPAAPVSAARAQRARCSAPVDRRPLAARRPQLGTLRRELEGLQVQLARTDRLIRIADPEGWLKPGAGGAGGGAAAAAAAAAAKAAAKAALEADRQRRAAAVVAQRAGWAAAQAAQELAPEEEEEEEDNDGGRQQPAEQQQPRQDEQPQEQQQPAPQEQPPGVAEQGGAAKPSPLVIRAKGALPAQPAKAKPAAAGAAGAPAGAPAGAKASADAAAAQLMREFAQPAPGGAKRAIKGPAMPPPAAKAAKAAAGGSNVHAAAAARVAASIAILTSHAAPLGGDGGEGGGEAGAGQEADGGSASTWLPPAAQDGSGRTSLNAKRPVDAMSAPAGKRRAGPTTRARAAAAPAAGEAPGGAEPAPSSPPMLSAPAARWRAGPTTRARAAVIRSLLPDLPEPLVLHILSLWPPSLRAWCAKLVCKAARERFRGARRVSLCCPELPLAAVQEAWGAMQGDRWQQMGLAEARAACGDVAGLVWLRGAGCDVHMMHRACMEAAHFGQIAVLEWAHGEGVDLRGDVCQVAADNGQLGVLRWARAQTPPLPWGHVCFRASRRGDLEMVRWARSQDEPAPWSEHVCGTAAMHGHLEALCWLRANGCPWERDWCERAAAHKGHEAVAAPPAPAMSAAPAGTRRAGPTTRARAAAAAGEAPGGDEAAPSSPLPELAESLVLHVLSFLPPALQAWAARLVCKAARERFCGATDVSLRCPELPLAAVQEAWRAVQGDGWQQRRLANARGACGDVAGLAWLRAAGCNMGSDVGCTAAFRGQLAVLEWARDKGLDLDGVCWAAANGGQIAMLRWARAQSPPLPWGPTGCALKLRRTAT
ncbi:SLC4A1AP [Scenedesmus sp. PABB004]|nr:SLC4A1AP [Scenedesmus sp. PABB004]